MSNEIPPIRKVKIESATPKRGRPREVTILGSALEATERVVRLSQHETQPDVPVESYSAQNPPPQPEENVEVEFHDSQKSFKEETRK
jgi:hypothetical protein